MLKSIFVAYNGSAHALAALEQACWLAARVRGKVYLGQIVELHLEPAAASSLVAGSIETMAAMPPLTELKAIAQDLEERETAARFLLEQATRTCAAWAVDCETLTRRGYLDEEILAQARRVDLVALGQSSTPGDRRKIGRLTESIVRGAARPVLMATAPFEAPTELLVLNDGAERSLHALAVAAEIAAPATGEERPGLPIHLITLAGTAAAGAALAEDAKQYLADHGVCADSTVIDTEATPARELVTRLNERPKALILMGAFRESRLREWLSGSTTRSILQETRHPVILFGH